MKTRLAFPCLALLGIATFLTLSRANGSAPQLTEGAQIYSSACAACHGPDGKGTDAAIAGFEKPETFPDFTRCDQTTMELDTAYQAVVTYGGPHRGFSQIMPSFGKALTPKQVREVVHYLRSFCSDTRWPRGELNLPRAFATEKAFPEDEEVWTAEMNARGAPGLGMHWIHEQRFGIKNQLEVDVPLMFEDQEHRWYGGIGDTVFGWKRVVYSSLKRGSIFSLQGEVAVPTGSTQRGFGEGTTTFGTFAMFDQLLPNNSFLQLQMGADLPTDTEKAPQNVYGHAAFGKTFAPDHGLGRNWSPMLEAIASRDLTNTAKTDWDILPQMQVTLSRRQHVRADLGVRVPVTNAGRRPIQVEFYVLWDWADGKLTEGW